ncbi:hypothetical protein P152DRAFT_515719 [Eremomyces bilateralis CBS 781.70]|uniref:Uncharacterized protein n=1 Tax=Eremomyces bilateralis CBS 781.70 TaxID=1392243 RepID=A0A6G1FY80_9PEZI|nr:uncharacterized protein P152DRAFT_515719 [Eremomyces bilateralis CBS 781.70]KAF1810539.1 hypothetical protein P152DRAFT_515719 [Eremomyces bilateralis CBS 781.70]
MPEQQPPIVSTGRGGSGNIGRDPTVYADGGIVREGHPGVSETGEYSSGRGGAGNIVHSPKVVPVGKAGEDFVPEIDTIPAGHQPDFHTGRGGDGNVHREKYGGHSHAPGQGFGDRVKAVLGLDKHKEKKEEKKDGPAS